MRKWTSLTLLATGLALGGCSRNITPNNGDTSSTDTGANDTGHHDTGTTDTSAHDTGTDTAVTGVDCSADLTGSTPDPQDTGTDFCVTGHLACGDTIDATTEGGSTWYGNDFDAGGTPEKWPSYLGCTGMIDIGASMAAPERVYTLDLSQATNSAKIVLDNHCGDLVLRAVAPNACSDKGDASEHCDTSSATSGGQTVTITTPELVDTALTWSAVVDGIDGYQGNFRLSVQCN